MRDHQRNVNISPANSRRILIVAYHFPPLAGSSGLLRGLKFVRYLPNAGWLPLVLSTRPLAYERLDGSQLLEVPVEVPVLRTFALDAKRHLSLAGRHLKWLALPDRWSSWILSAVPTGWLAMRKYKAEIIFTTFPIPSAVVVGLLLHKLTGKPWVVDFRDSMTEDNYPPDPAKRRLLRRIENAAMRNAALFLFTAPSTRRMYLERYPFVDPQRCVVVPNGYDENDFVAIGEGCPQAPPVSIVHSGMLYKEERDPRQFFAALARLKREGQISAASLRVDLRGSGNHGYLAKLLDQEGITDIVHLLPPLPYRESLENAARAHALLLLQAGSCDHQIPAKAYEYVRLQKPILALTTRTGDTAALLKEVGGTTLVDIHQEEDIYRKLPAFVQAVRENRHPLPDLCRVQQYSRQLQTMRLAELLNAIAYRGANPQGGN